MPACADARQGRALMLMADSYDAAGLRAQSAFPVGACPLPYPSPGNGRYRRNLSESDASAGGGLCLSRAFRHPEAALDFLRFFSSRA